MYAKGRTDGSKVKVTNARGGQSAHNFGMGVDLMFVNGGFKGPWDEFGREAEALGLVWGGRWKSKDLNHVERPNWRKNIHA